MVVPQWLGEEPFISEDRIAETITADVVVCGGGHAGLNVARAAAAGGASVVVLERQTEKGYRFFGEQIGHFNSQWLKDKGIEPVDLQEVVAEFQKRSGHRSNPSLIRQYVYHSGEMFDSLINLVPEDHDMLKMVNIHLSGDPEQKYPVIRGGYKTWAGNAQFRKAHLSEPIKGIGVLSYLTELNMFAVADAQKNGAKWYFKHSCRVLVKNDNQVTGCIAEDPQGRYIQFIARKGVALCCGDFSGNSEMYVALMDELRDLATARGHDLTRLRGMGRKGTGHKMGCWAGGYMEPGPRAAITIEGLGGPFGLTAMIGLNCYGERFCNESITMGLGPAIQRQPLGTFVGMFDAQWRDYMKMNSIDHGQPDFGVPLYQDQIAEDLEMVMAAGAEGAIVRDGSVSERIAFPGPVYGAKTLEKLSEYLGYDGKAAQNFLHSIKRYNRLCANGYDADFGKEQDLLRPLETPPYFAVKQDNRFIFPGLVSLAGLVTDNNQQVLSQDAVTPIKGLYASGNCCGLRYGLAYSTPVGGNSIGMAMTHGRLLGKYLATL